MLSTDRSFSGTTLVLPCVVLALGIVTAGFLLARGVRGVRGAERYVSVKGLAERELPADLAIWPLAFTQVDDDLALLQQKLDRDRDAIRRFLKAAGFGSEEISESAPSISDRNTVQYANEMRSRYTAQVTMTLRSNRIAAVQKAVRNAGDLVKQGVVLQGGYGGGAQYFFTGLMQVKPKMIAEATKNARQAAQQFASDSGSRVGAIRYAQQGLFSIEDRDQYTPEIKKVRVVTTVDYLLVGE
jgi:hypothetical protein